MTRSRRDARCCHDERVLGNAGDASSIAVCGLRVGRLASSSATPRSGAANASGPTRTLEF